MPAGERVDGEVLAGLLLEGLERERCSHAYLFLPPGFVTAIKGLRDRHGADFSQETLRATLLWLMALWEEVARRPYRLAVPDSCHLTWEKERTRIATEYETPAASTSVRFRATSF